MNRKFQFFYHPRVGAWLFVASACVLLGACGSERPYVWAQSVPAEQPPAQPIIKEGDHLHVLVIGHEAEREAIVGPDGTIVHALAGRIPVAGLTAQQAAERVAAALRAMITDARVVVAIALPAPARVSVVGEVQQAGTFEMLPDEGVLAALARAGGLTPFADDSGIYVLRKEPKPMRVRFRYDDLTGAETASTAFRLHDGDVVVVD